MPSPREILDGLTAIANESRSAAIGWHVLLAMLLLKIADRRRPSNQMVAILLVLPLISVSVLAWASGNPFNGIVFAVLSVALAAVGARLSTDPVRLAPAALALPGSLLVAFAACYPHFVHAESWTAYLYASPLGLVPCPTLAAIAGLALLLNLLESRIWSAIVAAAGVFYGAVGVMRLDVRIDAALLAGALLLGAVALRPTRRGDTTRAHA